MYISKNKTLGELLEVKSFKDKLKIGEAVICATPMEDTDYGKYEVYIKSPSGGFIYSGLFNKLENAELHAAGKELLSNTETERQGECNSATSQDCLYFHTNLENTSLTTSGTLDCGSLTAPTYFTSFVNNKVSFTLNMKDADELFRTLSVLINSGYKITLMSGSGEDGYVITYSPSDLTCSIIG